MNNRGTAKIEALLKKGVKIPNPASVDIDDSVDVDRISGDGVVIYAGCKIMGHSTLILQGATLGNEGPVTVENCHIGPQVELKGGYFKDAVFLKSVSMGLGSHIREGTILEENFTQNKVIETSEVCHVNLINTDVYEFMITAPFIFEASSVNVTNYFLRPEWLTDGKLPQDLDQHISVFTKDDDIAIPALNVNISTVTGSELVIGNILPDVRYYVVYSD